MRYARNVVLVDQNDVVDQVPHDGEGGVVVQSDAALKAGGEGVDLVQLHRTTGGQRGVYHRTVTHRYADHPHVGRIMVHEENVVLRSDGAHLLARRARPELPILG